MSAAAGPRALVAPSILAADLGRLAEAVAAVEAGGADWIHVDVMDGRFVPNLTFGADVTRVVRRATDLPVDVHLMVEDPGSHAPAHVDAGATVVSLHLEATAHAHRELERIRELGARAGLALNPGTPLAAADALWGALDVLLVMSVNPGWAGQAFIPAALDKLAAARERIDALPAADRPRLEVDGGIKPDNAAAAVAAGADVLVSGSGVFGAGDPARGVEALRAAIE